MPVIVFADDDKWCWKRARWVQNTFLEDARRMAAQDERLIEFIEIAIAQDGLILMSEELADRRALFALLREVTERTIQHPYEPPLEWHVGMGAEDREKYLASVAELQKMITAFENCAEGKRTLS